MIAVFPAILAFIKAIPAIKSMIDQFISWYVQAEIASMQAEVRAGIKKAVIEHDQRDLEKAIGNPNAGEASGAPGTVIRDHLPGVK